MAFHRIGVLNWGNEDFEPYGTAWIEIMPRVRLCINPDDDLAADARKDAMHRREPAPCPAPNKNRPDFWLVVQRLSDQAWVRLKPVWITKSKTGSYNIRLYSELHRKVFWLFFNGGAFTGWGTATLCIQS